MENLDSADCQPSSNAVISASVLSAIWPSSQPLSPTFCWFESPVSLKSSVVSSTNTVRTASALTKCIQIREPCSIFRPRSKIRAGQGTRETLYSVLGMYAHSNIHTWSIRCPLTEQREDQLSRRRALELHHNDSRQ